MKRFILPLVTVVCFYADSLYVEFFPSFSLISDWVVTPRFLLVVLILMGIYYYRNVTLIYAAIFGLLFDIYYTGLIGVYLFLFPISIYIASKMTKVLQINVFTAGLITIVMLSLVEILVYVLNLFLFNVQVATSPFVFDRLLPTLFMNLVFYLLIFFPFTIWLQKRKKEVNDE
ncbi:rod shape-determining protein MreD [Siminovitchia sediminis]|uniref:Rod shape-determining protein MreD n=1 Tax=Siminovitchia sediminis TaxID=1274353 RepID=A0ABW4KCP2_9BACI